MKDKPEFCDVIGFNDKWMLLIGIPLASVIVSIILFVDNYNAENSYKLVYCIPVSIIYTGLFWSGMRGTYQLVKKKYPNPEDLLKRIFWASLAYFLVYFLITGTLNAFFETFFPAFQQNPNKLVVFVVTTVLSALIISIYESGAFYHQLITTTKEKAELEKHYVSSQLEGLRNQVNPHFLFNSLNTLIYLIPEDSTKAVNFVQKMSKVYRYVLESRDTNVIPLAEELGFLNAYVFLLKERFGENLKVKLQGLDQRPNMAIVPLSFQMLFENAIKHNVISTEKPLTIEVFFENEHIVVRNNLQRKNQVMDSTGIGLKNIKDRYRMLTDKTVEVIVSQQYFTVLLPVIESFSSPQP